MKGNYIVEGKKLYKLYKQTNWKQNTVHQPTPVLIVESTSQLNQHYKPANCTHQPKQTTIQPNKLKW